MFTCGGLPVRTSVLGVLIPTVVPKPTIPTHKEATDSLTDRI